MLGVADAAILELREPIPEAGMIRYGRLARHGYMPRPGSIVRMAGWYDSNFKSP